MKSITLNMTKYHDLAPLINPVLNILILCAKVRAFYELITLYIKVITVL